MRQFLIVLVAAALFLCACGAPIPTPEALPARIDPSAGDPNPRRPYHPTACDLATRAESAAFKAERSAASRVTEGNTAEFAEAMRVSFAAWKAMQVACALAGGERATIDEGDMVQALGQE